ncbi:hypothetical protein FALBO_16240, partial [Fusarium albosuccineum]
MHFSSFLPTLGGLVACAQASPHLLNVEVGGLGNLGGLGGLGGSSASKQTSAGASSCSLANDWEDRTLFHGVAAPETETSPAINLGLHLPKAQISGDVQLELVKDFLKEPRVRVGLGGVTAFIQVDISASAAVHESIELFASSALDLEIPGLLEAGAGAAVALDLVVGVDAAIDLSTGVYISFSEEAYVEISLLTKDIVDVSLDGLVAKALPIGIGAEVDLSAEVSLQLDLRLRTEIDLSANLDIPILDIKAGAKIAVWVSLFDYTAVLIGTDDCLVSVSEVIALTLGLAVELDVEIGDILDLSLAPSLTVTLATAAKAKLCLQDRGTPGVFLEQPQDSASTTVSATTEAASSADPAVTTSSDPEADATSADPETTSEAAITTPAVGHRNSTAPHPTGDVTSTVTSTHVYTITSCAASVVNCPARYTQKVVTSTVIKSTFVCPAGETAPVTATSAQKPSKATVSVTTITDTLTTIVPCKERTTSTFHAPTNPPPAPTVTIVDRTTVCPATDKTAPATTGGSHVPTGYQSVPSVASTAKVPAPPSSEKPAPSGPAYPPVLPSSAEKPAPSAPVYTPVTPVAPVPTVEKPVPEAPTYAPVPPPVQSVPYPANNGTIPSKT